MPSGHSRRRPSEQRFGELVLPFLLFASLSLAHLPSIVASQTASVLFADLTLPSSVPRRAPYNSKCDRALTSSSLHPSSPRPIRSSLSAVPPSSRQDPSRNPSCFHLRQQHTPFSLPRQRSTHLQNRLPQTLPSPKVCPPRSFDVSSPTLRTDCLDYLVSRLSIPLHISTSPGTFY